MLGLVSDLKQAGVAVSPIVMVGIEVTLSGSSTPRDPAGLERMEPEPMISYISPFIEFEETEYARQRREAGIRLDEAEMERNTIGSAAPPVAWASRRVAMTSVISSISRIVMSIPVLSLSTKESARRR